MFKKLLFCFSFIAAQSQITQSLEFGTVLPKDFRLGQLSLQVLQNAFQYGLNTVKSDLSIGNNIAPHHTFVEQLAAAVRLACYGKVIYSLAEKLLGDKALGDKKLLDEVEKASLIEACLIIPLIEEIFFTYGPQILDRSLNSKGLIAVLASIAFGLAHKQNSVIFNTIRILSCYLRHRYMSERSIYNLAPVYRHIIHNYLWHLSK
jgi:hypothetical protein